MGPISETYRYIVRSARVRSGNPIVEGTRIAGELREAVCPQSVNRFAILEQANYVVASSATGGAGLNGL